MQPTASMLFSPLTMRNLTVRNRVVISPMCQYMAVDGVANDWHFAHLAKFAIGGAGLIFVEATAVEPRGRLSHACLGIWNDAQREPLSRITRFLREHGAASGIQLGHGGRKACLQRPWHGNGPLDASDADRGEEPWTLVAPSAIEFNSGYLVPSELSTSEIAQLVDDWRSAAIRSREAGFDAIEIHGAHGYLIHSFLSPLANKRGDAYGGSLGNRMRFALEVTEAVRSAWPEERPLFFRVSATDGLEGGWTLDDTVALSAELRLHGVDVIDCSSGGISPYSGTSLAITRRSAGFQVPFAARVRAEAKIATMAVGLIAEPQHAEDILQQGAADLIAIGRAALHDPNWPLHAQAALGVTDFGDWPVQYAWGLERRRQTIAASSPTAEQPNKARE